MQVSTLREMSSQEADFPKYTYFYPLLFIIPETIYNALIIKSCGEEDHEKDTRYLLHSNGPVEADR